ncbi:glycosyltransferase family protein [Gregarina niphandrodes]|uniref:Glycosyltransferase family protein n=1 Tax=Gregarina niphandrodes TaxID=110365 RepID=A0A023B228_GRENI|nr:glycosyltransferase family protein [Gregarina niphandrodes]EZG50617.1 glycosyltransferase family protein [Gregarina niphandrodes]|eukprot:XP_011132002.1 glycosyltransferase family protein [Gregarina niphandrodes]
MVLPDSLIEVVDGPEEGVDEGVEEQSDAVHKDDIMRVPGEKEEFDFAPDRLSPRLGLGRKVVGEMTETYGFSKDEEFSMIWEYGMEDKLVGYVGNKEFMKQFPKGSRGYLNSLAVFPYAANKGFRRYHGRVGVYPNGTQAWVPQEMPPPIDSVNKTAALKRGGFYLDLSNALELDRQPKDHRSSVCKTTGWDYESMGDASVVITFYNEPLSTLLRTVHSVLNNTPPPLLREIILVDDHSALPEDLPGEDLYEYIKLLPKTKLLRLPERRGLVWARLAGAHAAQGKVLVVLDSHVEVNPGWLEPQLERISESPKSIVFPQILSLDSENFEYKKESGIGCWLSWKWNMVEQASLTGELKDDAPIPSASMAGGLFAVDLSWFWELGGYDEDFAMWGSENVEMGFRTWMCGGRLECTPCALTYHIYRNGGVGYSSPDKSVWLNKLRTARLWMDEHFLIAKEFIDTKVSIGNVDKILELKERLKCKPFSWFLKNVDPTHEIQSLEDVQILGEIRTIQKHKGGIQCLDLLGNKVGEPFGVFGCHKQGGNQRWLKDRKGKQIISALDDSRCLGRDKEGNAKLYYCSEERYSENWIYNNNTQHFEHHDEDYGVTCLAIDKEPTVVKFLECDDNDLNQLWEFDIWIKPEYEPLDYSDSYKKQHFSLP